MDLLNLEQQRLQLEQNLQKLRESLKHWQTWEAEYEGLKEEIAGFHQDGLTKAQLEAVAKTYGGDLVNEKEVRDLTGLENGSPRTAKQILGLIERRQEYVQKNIETVQRQFFEVEAKSEELAFAARRESASNDGGLPLTEIHEELDEEGNVVSSSLSQPEESTAKVVESLRKAGVKEEDLRQSPERKKSEDLKPAITNASPPLSTTNILNHKRTLSDPSLVSPISDASGDDGERPSIRKKSVSFTSDTKAATERPRPESEDGKKSVSFNDKVAVMPAAPPPDSRSVSFAAKVEEIPPAGPGSPDMQATLGTAVTSPSDATSTSHQTADSKSGMKNIAEYIIPEGESAEDARLRRQMLEYNLNEVGNVVAQIDLDEANANNDSDAYDEDDDSSSFHTTSEYLDDDESPYTTCLSDDEDESEDELGRSKYSQITPEYRKQMEELQRKLIGNLGPAPKDDDIEAADPDLDPQDVRKLVIREKRNSTSSASSENSEKKAAGKKRVSFAEALDVAEPEPGSPPLKAQKTLEGENVAPVAESVLERSTASSHSLPRRLSNSNEGASKFKNLRAAPITGTDSPADGSSDIDMEDAAAIIDEPNPPADAIMASTLKERAPTRKGAQAPSLDNLDPAAQRRELAAEYYRRRNDMVRQQGGFKNSEEDEELGELMEERDGKVKKVSKFKAARLRG